jgi:hypothetical protein
MGFSKIGHFYFVQKMSEIQNPKILFEKVPKNHICDDNAHKIDI